MGPRGVECKEDANGVRTWYVYDGLRSVLAEVDSSGNVIATHEYDAFGAVRDGSGTSSTNHKFCGSLGHASENETGLIYMRARYYDPITGRFISEDPAKQGGNWYIYCGNSPLNSTDQDGQFFQLILLVVAIVACVSFVVAVYSFIRATNAQFKSAHDWSQRLPDDTARRYKNLTEESDFQEMMESGADLAWDSYDGPGPTGPER